MQIEEGDHMDSPSFRMYSPERISSAADDTTIKVEEYEDDDLEFSFVRIPESGSPIAADDIFSGGKILPVYPVFNRDLLGDTHDDFSSDFTIIRQEQSKQEEGTKSSRVPLRRLFIEEEREQASFSASSSASSSSSSSLDGLDGIPPETYCVWNPNQNPLNKDVRCKKSGSTGSTPSSLSWKLKDLVVGRSKSDVKEKFVFFPMVEKPTENQEKIGKGDGKRGKFGMYKPIPKEVDVVTAQRRMTTRTHHGQDTGKAVGRKPICRTDGTLWDHSMRMGSPGIRIHFSSPILDMGRSLWMHNNFLP